MINEFKNLDLICEGGNIVPRNVNGIGSYSDTLGVNQVCTLAGAQSGQAYVHGRDYINASESRHSPDERGTRLLTSG